MYLKSVLVTFGLREKKEKTSKEKTNHLLTVTA